MPRRWKLKPADEQSILLAATATGFPTQLARVMAIRDLIKKEEIDTFLKPRLADLSDPGLLPDMSKAVERVWEAIHQGESISVFGDYDVDGVTSAALLTRLLSALGGNVNTFIPDRLDEGYGLSKEAFSRCIEENKSTLVITVDCGTNATETISSAKAEGIDVIVTDHHEPEEVTADAFALINPKLGNNETLNMLAGVGVAFKFAHGIVQFGKEKQFPPAESVDLRNYLDFTALGTVTDIVPLLHENRIFTTHGLKQMEGTAWVGMQALKEVAGLRGTPEAWHLGFQLGPRINAAGRIHQPMQALRLLTTDDPNEARQIAEMLDQTNLERRKLEREIADEAFAEIDSYFDPAVHFGLVVARKGWHPGVVGIVASRIIHHYNRPAIVMGIDEDGTVRGSCRSIEEFDMLAGLKECEGLLIKYGGHRMAAGIELAAENLESFRTAFDKTAATKLGSADLSSSLSIDAVLSPAELDRDFMNQLKQLRPFGQDNPEPVWALLGIEVIGQPRVVGGSHLKFTTLADGSRIDAIAFNFPKEQMPSGSIDIAFTLNENKWNGRTSLQLQVKDVRSARGKL